MSDQGNQGLLSPYLRQRRMRAVQPWLLGAVLDVGCGSGALAAYCAEDTYCGYDIDAQSLAIARAQHSRHRFVDALPSNRTFDTVVSLAVIEHCKDPAEFLRMLTALTASGGRIAVTTPHPAFEFFHDFGSRIGIFSHDASEEHEVLLDHDALRELAATQGLRIVCYQRFLFGANQLIVMERS